MSEWLGIPKRSLGEIQTFFELLLPGNDINEADEDGNTVLHLAIKGRLALVQYLAEIPNINLNLKNKQGKTIVDLAETDEIRDYLCLHPQIEIS